MKEYLKTAQIKLKVCGPVFIGSGEKIGKKEYLLNRRTNTVIVFSQEKLFEGLSKRRLLREYEACMLGTSPKYNGGLASLMFENKIPPTEYKKWASYILKLDDVDLERGSLKEINPFIKDAYGCPYVPGSSMKGALRTVILQALAAKRQKELSKEKRQILSGSQERKSRGKYLKNECDAVEVSLLHTLKREGKRNSILNDCMTGIRISDSHPLSVKDITLCQKVDVNLSGEKRKLPLMRECLRPGTEVIFDVDIDTTMFPFTLKELQLFLEESFSLYEQYYLKKFKSTKNVPIDAQTPIYLGGGAGFVTKTFNYALFGEEATGLNQNIFDKTNVPRQHGHRMDKKYGVSPHVRKCTIYKGELRDMGLCDIALIEK